MNLHDRYLRLLNTVDCVYLRLENISKARMKKVISKPAVFRKRWNKRIQAPARRRNPFISAAFTGLRWYLILGLTPPGYMLSPLRGLRTPLSDEYSKPKTIIHTKNHREDWRITFVDTGKEAMTGARLAKSKKYITGSDFFLTYGDGVADIDLKNLYHFHRDRKRIATVTGIQPKSFGGRLNADGDIVKHFKEKPVLKKEWVSGGFFVCNKKIFDYLSEDDSCVFESHVLPKLAKDKELAFYKHENFWYTMNTYKEWEEMNEMWRSGNPGWKIWE